MWFKQITLFQLNQDKNFNLAKLVEKLESFEFKPCLPSMPSSLGWVPPVDEEGAPLARAINGYIMICLQIEEKILPATVVRQEVIKKIKEIERAEERKLGGKEKLALKDEMILTLLPRAFSKVNKIYAYFDTKNSKLILGSSNTKRIEQFLSAFKKSIAEEIYVADVDKLSSIMTYWLKHRDYPESLVVEKACLFQDPQQQSRIIRCQQQDLFAENIQSFIKEGYEVKQLALTWQDRVSFMMSDRFVIQGLRFQDEVIAQVKEMEPETKQQQFDADFLIMTEMLSGLLTDLFQVFSKAGKAKQEESEEVAA
jgi:recombination associated protein RdgC